MAKTHVSTSTATLNIYTGDPTACDLISWRESAHFRSMWWHDDPLNNEIDTEEEIGDEIEALQLPKLEAMYTYLNEKSGKHLPHVSNNVLNRGDGRKYKWIVGNTWGGGGSGWSILGLGHGAMYITTVNPHEYIHGTDNHQSTHVTSQWFETHAKLPGFLARRCSGKSCRCLPGGCPYLSIVRW